MAMGAQLVLDAARTAGDDQVHIIFVDYNGIPRGRSVPVAALPAVLERGINFSSPTVDFNARDAFPVTAAFDLASPDFWALPDQATYLPAAGIQRTGQLYANLVGPAGEPWPGCPRTALQRLEQRAETAGLAFSVGFEPEGYIFRRNGSTVSLAGEPQFATADGLNFDPDFMDDLLRYLQRAGIEVQQWSEEYGPGQLEINLAHGRPLPSADGLVTFKQAFRSVAHARGYLGTFMPKPFGDQAGSGLHVHLSAASIDQPELNLFDDPSDVDLALSTIGRQVLAGLLAHGAGLTALGATTVNSYKRFLPGSWAPTHVMYAPASRAAFIRIPEGETARRLELRIGDPAGNPYIYLTGILAAALDGIERRLEPGPPVPGVVGTAGAERPVPATLEAALDALESDDLLRRALGPVIFEEFIAIKRSEWQAFCLHVDEWDRAWYLNRF